MRGWWLCLCAAACSFPGHGAGSGDAPPGTPDAPPGTPDSPPGTPDAPPVPDAPPGTPDASPPDASPPDAALVTCPVVRTGTPVNASQVGASGGSTGPALACATDELVVGVAVRMSNQNTDNGGRSAHGFVIACAPVTITSTGPVVGPETTHEVAGTGNNNWTPSTLSEVTHCPAGSVVSGLAAHRGSSDNLFVDVTITCSALGLDGQPTGSNQDVYVAGSLTNTQNPDSGACGAGMVVRSFNTRRGAGFDAATPVCTAVTCN